MSLDLVGEKEFLIQTGSNNDVVAVAIDIPAGCKLKNLSISCDVIAAAAAFERETACAYAAAAYIFPVEDPDSRVDYNTLWDRFVPKYNDLDVVDLDTTAVDATPFWEPGEGLFDQVFDMGVQPVKIFGRKKRMNFADPGSAGMKFQPAETPFEPQYHPADRFNVKTNRPMRARQPSVMLLAVASPAYDDTTTVRAQLAENQWGQIQYAEATLERALMDTLALTEAGATIPWANASDTLRQYLAPDVFEEVAGSFVATAYLVFGRCSWTLNVPGEMDIGRVDLTP